MNKFLSFAVTLITINLMFFASNSFAYGGENYGVKHHGGGGKWHADNPWKDHGHNWQPSGYNNNDDSLSYKIDMNHSGNSDVMAETKGYGDDGHGETFTESVRDVMSEASVRLKVFPDGSNCGGACEDNGASLKHHMESEDVAKAAQWSAGMFESGSRSDTEMESWYHADGHLEIDRD